MINQVTSVTDISVPYAFLVDDSFTIYLGLEGYCINYHDFAMCDRRETRRDRIFTRVPFAGTVTSRSDTCSDSFTDSAFKTL